MALKFSPTHPRRMKINFDFFSGGGRKDRALKRRWELYKRAKAKFLCENYRVENSRKECA